VTKALRLARFGLLPMALASVVSVKHRGDQRAYSPSARGTDHLDNEAQGRQQPSKRWQLAHSDPRDDLAADGGCVDRRCRPGTARRPDQYLRRYPGHASRCDCEGDAGFAFGHLPQRADGPVGAPPQYRQPHRPWRVPGHEAVGTVVATGSAVSTIRPGDRVLASCISACGRAATADNGPTGSVWAAAGFSAISSTGTCGVCPDSLRRHLALPTADTVSNERAVMLADILPTSYELGVLGGMSVPATPSSSSVPDRSGLRDFDGTPVLAQ
jgi:hypothetical protein